MRYFTLVLALSSLIALNAQSSWSSERIAKFEFNDLQHGSDHKYAVDEFFGDTKLMIKGNALDDEPDPTGSNSAIGIINDGTSALDSYMEIIPGSHEAWEATNALSISFGFMNWIAPSDWVPVTSMINADGQQLTLLNIASLVRLEYRDNDGTNILGEAYSVDTDLQNWHAFNMVLDAEADQARLYINGNEVQTIDIPQTGDWEATSVYFSKNGEGLIASGWSCFSEIYLHNRALIEEDAATYTDVLFLFVSTEDILDQSNIQIFPNLVAADIPINISNPENTSYRGLIVDETGRYVQTFNDANNNLDISNLSTGIYRICFLTENGVVVRSLVKQ